VNFGEVLFSRCGEIVGVIFWMVLTWKVKLMHSLAICYGAAVVFSVALVAKDSVSHPSLAILNFMLAAAVMAANCGTWVVTPQAYPTHIRGTAGGVLYGAGRIGGLLATLWPSATPFVAVMLTYAGANAVCAVFTLVEGGMLERNGVLQAFSLDLRGSTLSRRSRPSVPAKPASSLLAG